MIHQDIFGILTIHTLISSLEILLFLCSALEIKFPTREFPLASATETNACDKFVLLYGPSQSLNVLNFCYILGTLFSIVTTIIAVYFNISKRLFWIKRFPNE